MLQRNCIIFFILLSLFPSAKPAAACEMCTVPRLGKDEGLSAVSKDKKWFFKYLFEVQNWHEKEAGEAHGLHHGGHHFHDKTEELIHHFTLGRHFRDEQFTLLLNVPYVTRESIEIHTHSILGTTQRSKGLGDIHLLGMFRVWQSGPQELRLAGGVKFPTGETRERNSIGERFETELQPGTGSDDYIIGGIYQTKSERLHWTANAFYIYKTEGAQNYEFGDRITASLLIESAVPAGKNITVKPGLDANLQYEQKHKDNSVKVADSGGTTLLIGPSLTMEFDQPLSVFASVHLPVYQDLGGVHQELDYTWTAGGRVVW